VDQVVVELLKQVFKKLGVSFAWFRVEQGAVLLVDHTFQQQNLAEGQRVKMEVNHVFLAAAPRKAHPCFPDEGCIGTGEDENGVFEQARVGKELDAFVPILDVADFVEQEILQSRFSIQVIRKNTDERMMVVDQLTGEEGDALGLCTLPKQNLYPLLEESGFADLTPPGDGVDSRLADRQSFKQGGFMHKWLLGQQTQVGVKLTKCARIVQVAVMRQKLRFQYLSSMVAD